MPVILNNEKRYKDMRQTKNHWTYETCMKESKKYNTRNEFKKGCSGAYNVARKNGWVDDFFPKCNEL